MIKTDSVAKDKKVLDHDMLTEGEREDILEILDLDASDMDEVEWIKRQ